jgi:hypothetical protein
LDKVVENDREEIKKQLSIYCPHFIIACGNGEHLSKLFDCTQKDRKATSSGVGYWKVKLENASSYLVDYCHPSIRVGTKIKGIVAKGLSSAIIEIENIAD